MKVLYHCYGGSHSSVTAAAIHLGLLPRDRVPKEEELKRVPFFDRTGRKSEGEIRLMGEDGHGNQVYVLGRKDLGPVAIRCLMGVARIFGIDTSNLFLVDTLPVVNLKMRVGGFTSRVLRLVSPGRAWVSRGTQQAYYHLVRLVEEVERKTKIRAEDENTAPTIPPGAREKKVVFYHCFGSAHSSVVSAALHLGLLPRDRVPRAGEICRLPYYDRVDNDEIGTPFPFGTDEKGYEVYIIGTGEGKKLIPKLIAEFLSLYGIPASNLYFVDALRNANWQVRVGGFLSRRVGLVVPGRYLTVVGIRRNYPAFVEAVEGVKDRLPGRAPVVDPP